MSKTILMSVMLIVSGLVGSAVAQKVNVDFDENADFAKYQTYTWGEGTNLPNPLQHQRMVSAVESELSAQGIVKVESNPDMFASYHGSATERVTYHTDSFGYGYGGRGWSGVGGGSLTTHAYTSVKGTIVLDMWDAETQRPVRRGAATDTLSDRLEKHTRKIHKAAEKPFKKYPPNKKK